MRNSNISISVILSVYNSEDTISESVESILSQSFSDFELLIMDDGSTDNTSKIISNLDKENSCIKSYRNKKNIGLTKSLNILINETRGEFIARQDADDVSYRDRFQNQIQFITENNLDGSTTRAKIKNSNRVIPGLSFYVPSNYLIKYKNPFVHGSLLIKKSKLLEVNCYDENFYYAQDYKLMKDLINNKSKVKILNKVLYELNMEDNISKTFQKEQQYYANCVKKDTVPNSI